MAYRQFIAHLDALGENDDERARKLGVCRKTISRWRLGRFPKQIRALLREPQLLAALAHDCALIADARKSDASGTDIPS